MEAMGLAKTMQSEAHRCVSLLWNRSLFLLLLSVRLPLSIVLSHADICALLLILHVLHLLHLHEHGLIHALHRHHLLHLLLHLKLLHVVHLTHG